MKLAVIWYDEDGLQLTKTLINANAILSFGGDGIRILYHREGFVRGVWCEIPSVFNVQQPPCNNGSIEIRAV